MNTINLKDVSLSSKISICWGMMWRAIVVGIGSIFISLPLGIFVGFCVAAIGFDSPLVITVPVGISIGGISYYYFAKWVIGASIGGYKLVLVKEEK